MAEKNCVTFIWKISTLLKTDEWYKSPEFYVNSLRASGWTLRLNIPPSYSTESSIDLRNAYFQQGRGLLYIAFEISILAVNPTKRITYVQGYIGFSAKRYHKVSGFPSLNTLFRERDDYLPEGILAIQCKLWKLNSTNLTPLFYQAISHYGARQISFEWSVKFRDLEDGVIQTKRFFLGQEHPIFKIETVTVSKQNKLGFDIEQHNSDFDGLSLSCQISVLDASGNVIKRKERSTTLNQDDFLKFPRFINIRDMRENRQKYLKDNNLELVFDFTYEIDDEEYSVVESISQSPPQIKPFTRSQNATNSRAMDVLNSHLCSTPSVFTPEKKATADAITLTDNESDLITQTLKDDLHDMYLSNSWSDVVLEAEGRSYPCHKCILSSRSPVFQSLLSDSTTYTLELKASVLGSMLQFIYTGDIGIQMDFQIALELYETATEYQIVSLKNVCSKFLEDKMTEENVLEVLILAFKLEDIDIKTRTENFILRRAENILRSDKWKDLVKNDSIHIVEIMHRIYLEKEKGDSSSLLLKTPSVSFTIVDCIEKSREEHKSNFLSIYKSPLFSDFELYTKNGKTFAVHKNILWARSPVFKAMLSTNMEESSMRTLHILDLEEQTLERLIRFLYTATLEASELEEFFKLCYAADKYQVLSLKDWCSKSLAQALSLKNVCEILKMSDQHGNTEFKNEVLDFLTKNGENVVLSPEWKNLMETDSQLASEAMYKIIARKANLNIDNSEIESEKSLPLSESKNENFSEIDTATLLQVDFISLYEEKFLSDCMLCTDDRSFEVHKNILCARSPVFNAMFSGNLEEATTNILVIPDIDGQTVDQMLRYMYTGTFEDNESVDLCKLYYAADKYQINSLRDRCSHLLSEKISVKNVYEILLLAYRHGDISLETAVQSFLIKNNKEVFKSDSWKDFMLNEPKVSCETLLAIY